MITTQEGGIKYSQKLLIDLGGDVYSENLLLFQMRDGLLDWMLEGQSSGHIVMCS